MKDWSKTTVLNDCMKKFLLNYQITKKPIVIVDNFADVRFGYSELLGTRVTHNVWQIGKSDFESNFDNVKDIKPTGDLSRYLKVYRESIRKFVLRVRDANYSAAFILNCARAATDEVNDTGTIRGKYKLAHFNKAWEALDKAFIETVPECQTISVDPSKVVACSGHPWGAGYVHYIPEFYEEFLQKLDALNYNIN